MNAGTEWLVDAHGCAAERLRDVAGIRAVLDRVIFALDLRVIGEPLIHRFPGPAGVTALYLLTESHLACHTFPETGIATFNLYCCRPRQPFDWVAELRERLGAAGVSVRSADRGAAR
jgi:S-adenosylmethionine decarboxylase